jgi:hypothetical protein
VDACDDRSGGFGGALASGMRFRAGLVIEVALPSGEKIARSQPINFSGTPQTYGTQAFGRTAHERGRPGTGVTDESYRSWSLRACSASRRSRRGRPSGRGRHPLRT